VLQLWLDLVEYHRRLDPDYPRVPCIREVLLKEIERGVRMRSCRVGVAEDEAQELVGFVFAEVERGAGPRHDDTGVGWIHELYVDSAWRQRGVANALLAFVEEFFAQRSPARVSVRVESGSKDGLRFWLRRGFAERERTLSK
jgi:GNAT superfamily N-acetyltransferase